MTVLDREGVREGRVKAIRDEDECRRSTGLKRLPETVFCLHRTTSVDRQRLKGSISLHEAALLDLWFYRILKHLYLRLSHS